jgi:uncharacterized membrane protein YsdA (DUF1294 family)
LVLDLWQLLGIYLLGINFIAFCVMGIDKARAKRGNWRISEKALFLPTLLGGALGGLFGMYLFHHKTRHWYFRLGFSGLFVAQIALLVWILVRFPPH